MTDDRVAGYIPTSELVRSLARITVQREKRAEMGLELDAVSRENERRFADELDRRIPARNGAP